MLTGRQQVKQEMSKITKSALRKLTKGRPKRVARAPLEHILRMAEEIRTKGMTSFPYYTKNRPQDRECYRGRDTRILLEREVGAFYYVTGNWEHLNDGQDTMICFQDQDIIPALEDAGFKVREQNTAKAHGLEVVAEDAPVEGSVY